MKNSITNGNHTSKGNLFIFQLFQNFEILLFLIIENYRPTLDGWELRKGINDMQGYDNFPEPKIVVACLEACRRLNEHSVAVRYLEALKVC
jgi:hypothetical protein